MPDKPAPATTATFRDHSTPPRGAPPAAGDLVGRARAGVVKGRAELEQADRERRRLRWFPLLALVTPFLALPFDWRVALGLFGTWMAFWAAGAYLNFFHRKDCEQKLDDAQRALHDVERAQV